VGWGGELGLEVIGVVEKPVVCEKMEVLDVVEVGEGGMLVILLRESISVEDWVDSGKDAILIAAATSIRMRSDKWRSVLECRIPDGSTYLLSGKVFD
jgi:hypothetical protein